MSDILTFFDTVDALKNTIRYKNSDISNKDGRKESSADHSYKMAMLIPVIAKEYGIEIDQLQAIKLALVHDLVESVTDDIDCTLVYFGRVRKSDKRNSELESLPKMVEGLCADSAKEITNLWKEYDECKTKEARFVKALDKIEAIHTLICLGPDAFDIPRMIAVIADKPVEKIPELTPLLKKIKTKLKEEFEKADIPWEDEYNFGLKV